MRAVVTGGAGFIGSHLTRDLLDDGWQIVVLDNLSSGRVSNVPDGAQLALGDIADLSLLNRLLKSCDCIFHLAAVSSVAKSFEAPLDVNNVNLTATLHLLEVAARHKVKRFVFSSSAAVYGDIGKKSAREDLTPAPLSHYAVQKLAAEHYCRVYTQTHGMDTVCLRYFNVFGPRQTSDSPYSGAVAAFCRRIISEEPLVVYGDGMQTRDFCHVSDVSRANIQAAILPASSVSGKVFNVAYGESTSVLELIEAIAKVLEREPIIRHAAARSGEIRHSAADITEAQTVLLHTSKTSLLQGLHALLVESSEELPA